VNKATVLFVFAPAIANQAGVTGTQTSTIMVRALAVGEPRKTIAMLIGREVVIGLVNGVVVGLILALAGIILEQNFTLAFALFAAMIVASAVAAPIGQLVPLGLRLLRADPALSSSIFVTMFTDGVSYGLCVVLAALLVSELQG
jgi:magnesium transporter